MPAAQTGSQQRALAVCITERHELCAAICSCGLRRGFTVRAITKRLTIQRLRRWRTVVANHSRSSVRVVNHLRGRSALSRPRWLIDAAGLKL